jgi:hypothetical protein
MTEFVESLSSFAFIRWGSAAGITSAHVLATLPFRRLPACWCTVSRMSNAEVKVLVLYYR